MRTILCHNPTAGAKGHDKDAILAAMKLADMDVRYISTKDSDFPKALADAIGKNTEMVVAAGGDGTICKVLTALEADIPVALLPLGTANNVARSLGIAGTPQELVETWRSDHLTSFDIGMVKGAFGTRYFVESFGVGVFGDFLRIASRGKKPEGADNIRKGRGHLQKALKDAETLKVTVKVDGKTLKGDFLGLEAMNTIFTGPGLPLAAKADLGDGKLDLICFNADARKDMIAWIDAPHDEKPPVTVKQGEVIEITWEEAPNRIDDAYYENEDKKHVAEISCRPAKARILIPVKHPAQKAQAAKLRSA